MKQKKRLRDKILGNSKENEDFSSLTTSPPPSASTVSRNIITTWNVTDAHVTMNRRLVREMTHLGNSRTSPTTNPASSYDDGSIYCNKRFMNDNTHDLYNHLVVDPINIFTNNNHVSATNSSTPSNI
ncbi:unnamed protein product [Heterobilharzia americana]|nr:unnamed protein product [Heterobilharzia americana]